MASGYSFYNLDSIIEKLEKRLESSSAYYQKAMERFTNIILIYSAISIFLIPIIQDLLWLQVKHWLFLLSFAMFSALFVVSLFFTIRLLIPVAIAYLDPFQKYYTDYREQYESQGKRKEEIDQLLKASYIIELEEAVADNSAAFRKKSHFYFSALTSALLSAVPYLICLAFHVAKKEDKVHKVDIVNERKK